MDLWVVAAAAAAGYFSKYWQNLSRDRGNFPEYSSSRYENPENPNCHFHSSVQRGKLRDVSPEKTKVSDRKFSDIYQRRDVSAAEVDSNLGVDCEKMGNSESYTVNKGPLLLSLPSRFLTNENLEGNEYRIVLGADVDNDYGIPSTSRMETFYDFVKNRNSLRTKHTCKHFVKPLSSLDSCVMAQLFKEHAKLEEYVLSSLPSRSTPALRPLLVTDGRQIISRASSDSFGVLNGTDNSKLHAGANFRESVYPFGVPSLANIGSLGLSKKMKVKRDKVRNGRSNNCCKTDIGKHSRVHDLQDGTFLCLAISIGMILSCVANRREVDKLKALLKQTENLVQDLQEELEMKDSMTVKELANEDCELQETCDNTFHDRASNILSPTKNMNNSTTYDGQESYYEKAGESSEFMSKIEAELEAELERLGLDMNTSSMERRLSDHVELESDFEADFAQGELRADMINEQDDAQAVSNQDGSGTSTTHSVNYAVSPRELSMRLYEVIQSRLEERVQELETALQNSQRKVKRLESDQKNSWRKSLNSELKFSLTQGSPEDKEESVAQPLVLNLSGEALDAYNEAYEELTKINESEEEDYENNHQEGQNLSEEAMSQHEKEGINGSSLPELFASQVRTSEEHSFRVQELLDIDVSEDESGDSCDDEMQKQLIKQIVEQTKKGSPVVLNAQRILFSMDEN